MNCPYCTTKNDRDARFCIQCGKDIPQSKSVQNPIGQDKNQKKIQWILIIGIIVFILILNIFIVMLALALGTNANPLEDKKQAHSDQLQSKLALPLSTQVKWDNQKFKHHDDLSIPSLPSGIQHTDLEYYPIIINKLINSKLINNKPIRNKRIPDQPSESTDESLSYLQPAGNTLSPKADSGETRLELKWVYSQKMGYKVPVYYVLPPSYDSEPDRRYPIVIMLGGASAIKLGLIFSAKYWPDRCGVQRLLRILYTGDTERAFSYAYNPLQKANLDFILSKAPMAEMILVCPNTFNGLWPGYLNYLSDELIPFTDEEYRTIPDRAFRGIDGACLGGAISLYLGFDKPEVFGSIGSVQADLHDFGHAIEQRLNQNWDTILEYDLPVNLNTGYADVYRWSIESFGKRYSNKGLNVIQNTYRGAHTYEFYRNQGGFDALLFHSNNFQRAFAQRNILKAPEITFLLKEFLLLDE